MRKLTAFRVFNLFLIFLALFSPLVLPLHAQGRATVDVLTVEGAVTPVVARYIERGIQEAESNGAQLLVIRLDTPGGSVTVMQEIVQAMIAADVPIAVYVAPEGAQAVSAGTFLVLAGHIAAMAPNTRIGAASPVGGQGEDLPETAKEKTTNVLVAQIKGLADRRGERAVAWAEKAVRSAEAAEAKDALELGVIDMIVPNVDELLAQVDGQEVRLQTRTVVLRTAGAEVIDLPMTLVEQFLHTITDPNIAYILLILGINGLLFELANPGGFLAGVIGAICLVMGFYALGVLDVNYAGLALIALAFVLFVVDVKAPTHGVLTVGGVISFVLGSLILFNTPFYAVSRGLIASVALITAAFFAFAIGAAVRAQRQKPTTGLDGLIGAEAQVRSDLDPEGTVFLFGERWKARTEGHPIKRGEIVRVVGAEGFELIVEPLATSQAGDGSEFEGQTDVVRGPTSEALGQES
ncbi:MAG: nodulation protein NfeD [Chloroflexi bacterium]|nr:MAG: nodulation protein NfeD [Chloroflexota bacterium]